MHFTPYKLIVIFDKKAQAKTLGASKFSTSVSHAEKSAMMRRLIGLDRPGGIINTVTSAGRRRLSLVPGLSSLNLRGGGDGEDVRPAGLGNWDNSCYQNSVLQGLASLKDFGEYLEGPYADDDSVDSQKTLSDEAPGAEMQMANSLRNLIHQLNSPSNNGTRLWTPAALKNMSSWQQQDAQEYFSKLLDEVDKEIERAALKKSKPPSAGFAGFSTLSLGEDGFQVGRHFRGHVPQLRNPLEGLLAQRVACTICQYTEGLSLIPFTTLTLTLPSTSRPSWQTSFSLSELLDAYTKLEFIDEVVCTSCTLHGWRDEISSLLRHNRVKKAAVQGARNHLKRIVKALEDGEYDENFVRDKVRVKPEHFDLSTKSKQVVIARPPRGLVVHVNRSMFNERTGQLSKNTAPVNFGHKLDLGPWCLGSASRPATKSKGIQGPDEEDWTTNPSRSMISRSTPDTSPAKYVQNGLASQGIPGYEYAFHPEKKSMLEGPIYGLRAVIVHQGHHENGHYITYRKYAVPVKKEDEDLEMDMGIDDDTDGGVQLDPLSPLNKSSAIDAASSPNLSPPSAPRLKPASLATPSPDRESTPTPSSSRPIPNLGDGKEEEEQEMRDQWFRISDDDVHPVTQSEVLARSQGVFMLFYDQISPARRVDAVSNPPEPLLTDLSTPELKEELKAEGLKVAPWVAGEKEEAEEEKIYVDDDEVCEENMQIWLRELDILSADGAFDRSVHHDFSSPDTAIYAPLKGKEDKGGDGSPDTAIYDPVRGREGVPSPIAEEEEVPESSHVEHMESVEEEPESEHVDTIPPTLPCRIQEVKPEDLASLPDVLSPAETPGSEHVEDIEPSSSLLSSISRESTIEPSESDLTSQTSATSITSTAAISPVASSPVLETEKEVEPAVPVVAEGHVPERPAPGNKWRARGRKRGNSNKGKKGQEGQEVKEGKMTERGGALEEASSGKGRERVVSAASGGSGGLLMV